MLPGRRLRAGAMTGIATLIAALIASQEGWPPVIRLFGAVPLVLVLPGFAITQAAFARSRLDRWEAILLSLGLSLAVTALCGLALAELRVVGIGRDWVIVETVITVAALAVLYLRRDRAEQVSESSGRRQQSSTRDSVLLALAPAVAILAIAYAVVGALGDSQATAMQLWMVPDSQDASSVRIGVANQQSGPGNYRVELVDGVDDQAWSVDFAQNAQTWTVTVALAKQADPREVTLTLVAGGKPIREARYWFEDPGA
jgi:uncharacterized membrane protein